MRGKQVFGVQFHKQRSPPPSFDFFSGTEIFPYRENCSKNYGGGGQGIKHGMTGILSYSTGRRGGIVVVFFLLPISQKLHRRPFKIYREVEPFVLNGKGEEEVGKNIDARYCV